jgi:hypothetical protein
MTRESRKIDRKMAGIDGKTMAGKKKKKKMGARFASIFDFLAAFSLVFSLFFGVFYWYFIVYWYKIAEVCIFLPFSVSFYRYFSR